MFCTIVNVDLLGKNVIWMKNEVKINVDVNVKN